MKCKAKYGAVGTITFSDLACADGINEKGRAIGVFYFPGYARCAKITDENRSKALSPADYTQWTVARDPQGGLRLYFKSYDDQTVRRVDLKKFDTCFPSRRRDLL